MKILFFSSLFFILFSTNAQVKFDDYFQSKALRFDYTIAGNADTCHVFFQKLKEEPYWSGQRDNLIDTFFYGEYRLEVFDLASNQLIFSKGYATLFYEWQTTAEAKRINKSYYESVRLPYPKKPIKIRIKKRNNKMNFVELYSQDVAPDDYMIIEETPPDFKIKKIHDSGNYNEKLDLVIIAEGYTQKELKKFKQDAQKQVQYILNCSPYKENKDKINIWQIEAISEESGSDLPGNNTWKKTAINTHFYTFGMERYLTIPDIETMNDIAALVPYDLIIVLANTKKYGGCGIYNSYAIVTNSFGVDYVVTHEMGHALTALADEYELGVTYDNFFPLNKEPYQPNITTLVNFDKKWKTMINDTIPQPTPNSPEYKNVVGLFEGGGYVSKGVYRAAYDCSMRSATYNNFCPVCKKAIEQMINFYAK